MTSPLVDVTAIPSELLDTIEADGWTLESLAAAKPGDLTGYEGIGPVTEGRIIEGAQSLAGAALQPATTKMIRSLSATRLVVPLNPVVEGVACQLSQRYTFAPGQIQAVPAADADILLRIKTKSQGCCNSDETPRNLFDDA